MLTWMLALAVLQAPAAPAPSDIRNFLQVTPEFCTGGQPRMEHFAQLRRDGVKAVLNLRQPSEHRAAEEQQAVEAAGLKYFNIPVNYQQPTESSVDEFLKITDEAANRPMFIHCTAAIRVGAFWAIRRVLRDNMDVEAALKEGSRVGLRDAPHLDQFVRQYVAKRRK